MHTDNAYITPTLQWVISHCKIKRYRAKSLLMHTGDPSKKLYYFIKGSAAVFIKNEEQKESILWYLNEGMFIGSLGLFELDSSYGFCVRTKTCCEIAEINYDSYKRLMLEYPSILVELIKQISFHLENAIERIKDLCFTDLTSRIAKTLIHLTYQPDAMSHPEGIQLKLTREEIGQLVGCSRETVGRILRTLESQQLLSAKGKTIIVHRS